MSHVAVLGAGSWGTTFAKILADAGRDVTVWSRREQVAAAIRETGCNPGYHAVIDTQCTMNKAVCGGTCHCVLN